MSLCLCGCGQKTKERRYFIHGHNNGVPSPMKGMFGELNHQYIDGRSFLPYCHKFNSELKESVRIRDNHTCQLCGNIQNNRKHDVHHIHYDKENCYPDLICLCMKCNRKVNFNREHYTLLFINNLNDRGLLFWNIYEK